MNPRRCKDCLWFDYWHPRLGDTQGEFGYCRKHKPIVALRGNKYFGDWPQVDKNDFCGEFKGT